MLQWLAVLVLGHQAMKDPGLLGRSRSARDLRIMGAGGPGPPKQSLECGCCKREVAYLDGTYGTCDACANCLSLGHCYDPAEGDRRHNVQCCHGENHRMVILGMDHEKGIVTVGERTEEAPVLPRGPDIADAAWAACTPEEREKLDEMVGRFRAQPDHVARAAEWATPLMGGPGKPEPA